MPADEPESITVAIVDTETTGLGPIDQPISVGVLLLEVDQKGALVRELASYYGLRQPTVPIDPEALAIHGISMAELSGHDFDFERLDSMFSQADFLIAHNAAFDGRMLAPIVDGIHRKSWRCSAKQIWWSDFVDIPNRKLDTICNHFGIARPLPHNALDDCRALADALLRRTGSTNRSRTYLGVALSKPELPIAPPDRRIPPRQSTESPRSEPTVAEHVKPTFAPAPDSYGWRHVAYALLIIVAFLVMRRLMHP